MTLLLLLLLLISTMIEMKMILWLLVSPLWGDRINRIL